MIAVKQTAMKKRRQQCKKTTASTWNAWRRELIQEGKNKKGRINKRSNSSVRDTFIHQNGLATFKYIYCCVVL